MTPEDLEVVTGNADIYLAFMKKNREELWDIPITELLDEVKNNK